MKGGSSDQSYGTGRSGKLIRGRPWPDKKTKRAGLTALLVLTSIAGWLPNQVTDKVTDSPIAVLMHRSYLYDAKVMLLSGPADHLAVTPPSTASSTPVT